ncbi:hypothetical protein PAHAL_7G186700 [Panicum hallii]|uniref:Uncharacterized protein n=1 Tax=Panicum hallii TaxID=206008 RepID=A0A2S3I7J9_9POAL|nr:hypothetical protein PAHAL_7G186700 [Panicum hallii]
MEDIDHHAMVMMLELRRQAHRSPPMAACRLRLLRWRLARRQSGSPPVEGGGCRRLGGSGRSEACDPDADAAIDGGWWRGDGVSGSSGRDPKCGIGGYSANSRYVFYKSTTILDCDQ